MPEQLITPIHCCHLPGCNTYTPPIYLMCKRHWYMVPPHLQALVHKHYKPGQEIDKNPSVEYLRVSRLAIAAVQNKTNGT
ncbi:hypothetical protein [Cylindrospermum sp. FACHB-282]|uniref:hypothetical protein n=1 Tax=Cylindrospermum sp. FACHB-282 TaxID=2692794 RepID=UPI0016837B6C|nr:hypothetical protein [Cylindrospermum sp. FACHB-282]MBD2386034.1 hypothetical protein [Cylindrospermum sp. FACHB-282]